MPLTVSEKMQVRRHLRYPVAGNIAVSPAGGTLAQGFTGYRFFQGYGALEYKMNNLQPVEEAAILGSFYGAAALVGQPNGGDQVSVTLSGGGLVSPVTVTATAPANPLPLPNGALNLAATLAAGINSNPLLNAAKFVSLAPYGTGPFASNAVPIPELSVTAPAQFAIVGAGTGVIVPQITADGTRLQPSASLDGGCVWLWGYLAILNGLESAYAGTSDNLDTAKADVWTARASEAAQRRSLYENWRQMFGDFLGVALYENAGQRPKRSGAISYL